MSASLPNVTRYLEQLPQGIDSHAHCMVKASVYRDALESRGLQAVLSDLPSDVQELVEHPPPVSAWVREVHTNTIMIAIRDAHFDVGAAGLREYGEWTRKRNSALLTRPLYRALFLVLSPQRLLRGAERRWGAFRRGTSLVVTNATLHAAALEVQFPQSLYEETALAGMRAAMTAALEAAGARDIEMQLASAGDRHARYDARWR